MKLEIFHDLLAKSVFDSASAEDKARAKAEAIIKARFLYYQGDTTLLLGEGDLNFTQPFLKELNLTEAEQGFVSKSQEALNRQKSLLRNRNYIIATMALLLVLMPFGAIGWYNAYSQSNKATKATKEKVKAQDSLQFAQQEVTVLRKAVTGEVVEDDLAKVIGQNDVGKKIKAIKPVFKTVRIWGTVKSSRGRFINDATVQLFGAVVKTGRDGRFDFYVLMPPYFMHKENLNLEISARGYSKLSYEFKPQAEIKEDFELSLAKTKLDIKKNATNIKTK